MNMEKVTLEQLEVVVANFWGKAEYKNEVEYNEAYRKGKEVFNKAQEQYRKAIEQAVEASWIALQAAKEFSNSAEEYIDKEDQYIADGRLERVTNAWKYLKGLDDSSADKLRREEFRYDEEIDNSDR